MGLRLAGRHMGFRVACMVLSCGTAHSFATAVGEGGSEPVPEGGGPCAALNGPICVGADSACQFTDLQDAIDSASESGGEQTTIHVASNQDYTGQHLAIVNRNLTIRGGYSSCSDFTPSGTTTLHGFGLDFHVIRINADAGHRDVVLGNLELRDGGPAGPLRDMHGGGVLIEGQVTVTISGSTIRNNSAVSGGGIYLDGHSGAELILDGTEIASNTAENNFYNGHLSGAGGGIYCRDGGDITMHGGQIIGNVAVPDTNGIPLGGGVVLDHCTFSGTASGEQGGVRLNIAQDGYGGGFYLADGSLLQLHGTGAGAFPLKNNIAGWHGGGVFMESVQRVSITSLDGVAVESNIAGFGNTYGSGGGIALHDGGVLQMDSFACTACSTLKGNSSSGDGAAVHSLISDPNSDIADVVTINNTLITENSTSAYSVIFLTGYLGFFEALHFLHLGNDVVVRNHAENGLISAWSIEDGSLDITSTTIADNDIDSPTGIFSSFDAPLNLSNSIIREAPDTPVQGIADKGIVNSKCVMVHAGSGLPTDPGVLVDDPRFVDADAGDYHLQPDSRAIDFCTETTGVPDEDLDGNPRGVDAPQVPPFQSGATYDLGAYEWQPEITDRIFADGFES